MASVLPSNLAPEEQQGHAILKACGQEHLLAQWPAGNADAAEKKAFLRQVTAINGRYPGGLAEYVRKGKQLLVASRKGENPLKGVTPNVPQGEFLGLFTPEFARYEALGKAAVKDACFVLVAGGLGERLGYNGIKIALPTNTITNECYLEYYCQWLQAFQSLHSGVELPFVIMTSGDTHEKTVQLLTSHGYFGLNPAQVTIVKQEKVPTMRDEQATLVHGSSPYELQTKPHGNGDVHLLLQQHGIARGWKQQGKKWVVFFQDTNGLAFNVLLPTLGLSAERQNMMTTCCVPRVAGEAIGCITNLVHDNGSSVVCNVEYNQIDPLLKALSGGKEGDTADPKTGFSKFPGNTNTLVMAAGRYADVLDASGGVMPEFVNPKYADAARTQFKSPTRLECMMEDYPKLLKSGEKVGFASFDRWASFSPCKNNLKDAKAKSDAGLDAWGAFSAEADFYRYNIGLLRGAGCRVAAPATRKLAGVKAPLDALVWFSPSFTFLRCQFAAHFPTPGRVSVSSRSALVVDGRDITIHALDLDGALVIRAVPGASVTIKSLRVRNKSWSLQEIADPEAEAEVIRIRGYAVVRKDQMVLNFTRPGRYVINDTSAKL